MPVFSGNTSGSIASVAYNIPSDILSFSLVNKAGGAITVNVYISNGVGSDVSIIPYNLSLDAGEAYISDERIKMLANNNITIITSGSVDYYFTIL